MAMREARLEVDGEPVAEGEAGVLRVRAVWVVRVRRNETARTTRRPWSRAGVAGDRGGSGPRGSGGPTTRRLARTRPTRDGVKPPCSRAALGGMEEVFAS